MVGPSRLHGPHHSAQKSTRTGCGALMTDCSKLVSVRVVIFSDAMYQCLSEYPLRFRLDRRNGPFIHFDILPGGSVPREVKFHAVLLDLPPFLGFAEEVDGPPHGGHQVRGRVSPEFEAISTG